MNSEPYTTIHYKWDPRTFSGYRLVLDPECAGRGLSCPYHVEDWIHHSIVQSWDCEGLEAAVKTLSRLFDIDVEEEIVGLRRRFGRRVVQAA